MLKMSTRESKICTFTAPCFRLQLLKVEYNSCFNYLYEVRENRKKIAEKKDLLTAMNIFYSIQQKYVCQNILNKQNELAI